MENKILLVTGASSDIGINLIEKVHENYKYILAHHIGDDNKLIELKEKLGDKLQLFYGNFLEEESTYEFVENIKNSGFTPTDIVHLPAGKYENIKFSKIKWNKFEQDLNIALRSLVIVLNSFLPTMAKENYGKVVVMLSSCTLNIPPKFVSSYVTTKYALLGLVKALSNEYADKGIKINGISPTMIETKFLNNLPNLIVEQTAFNSPTGKNLSVSDVIPMFQFLLSDNANCITGQNFAITNGNIM